MKFLIPNPTAFLERSILEKLSEVDAIKQAIIVELHCKWVTVDKLFHQQYKKGTNSWLAINTQFKR